MAVAELEKLKEAEELAAQAIGQGQLDDGKFRR